MANFSEPDEEGKRVVSFELNGLPRQTVVVDKTIQPKSAPKVKADPADPLQVAAPIPGMVTSIAVSVGTKVNAADKLLTLEAMKMYTTLTAPAAGIVDEILTKVGATVESKDLIIRLRKK